MNTVLACPDGGCIWAICPSTQTAPRRCDPVLPICRLDDRGGRARGDSGGRLRVPWRQDFRALPPTPPYDGGMTTNVGMPRVLAPDEAERAVLLAAPRGYCAGVDRAVVTVEKALDLYGSPVYVRKQIVHNKHVVAALEDRGAIFVEELAEVPEGATWSSPRTGCPRRCTRQAAQRSLRRSTPPARWSPRCTTRHAASPATTTTSC